jgi:hypothetical protein
VAGFEDGLFVSSFAKSIGIDCGERGGNGAVSTANRDNPARSIIGNTQHKNTEMETEGFASFPDAFSDLFVSLPIALLIGI